MVSRRIRQTGERKVGYGKKLHSIQEDGSNPVRFDWGAVFKNDGQGLDSAVREELQALSFLYEKEVFSLGRISSGNKGNLHPPFDGLRDRQVIQKMNRKNLQ